MRLFYWWLAALFFIPYTVIGQNNLSQFLRSKSPEEKVDYIMSLSSDQKRKDSKLISEVIDEIKVEGEKENDFYLLTKLEILKVSLDYYNHHYEKAIPGFNAILNNSKLLTTQDSIQVFFYLKNSYVGIKNASKAFEIHKSLMAIDKRQKIKSPSLLDPPLSVIYMEMGLYESAVNEIKIEYRNKSAQLTPYQIAQCFNNIGVYYNRWEKYDSAYSYFYKADKIIENEIVQKGKSDELLFFDALIDGNIGSVLTKQERFEDAIPKIKKDIYWSLRTLNLESATNAYLGLATCYCKTNKHDLARTAIDSALILCAKTKLVSANLLAHKINAEVYQAAKNYKQAAEEYAYYASLKDSITLAERQIQLVHDQVAFELDEKESQLKEQRLKIEEGQRALDNNKSNQIILILVIVAIALISMILFVAYKNSTKKQRELEKKNEEISTKNKLIEQSLSEQEALIKEVHHRVKNNMQIISSLLRLQSSKQNDEHVQAMFDESVRRIQSMALVHELLYKNKNLVSIPIHTYIKNLVTGLSSSYGLTDRIEINIHSDEVQLDIDTTVPLGLIINELITNSIKHAFGGSGGRVDIFFLKAEGKYKLTVQDNGKGLPPNFESLKENSLGMELVEALAEQINAKYSYSSVNGSKFEFVF